jgi:hypothetical protein
MSPGTNFASQPLEVVGWWIRKGGYDRLIGNDGNDVLDGGDGWDWLFGGNGDDLHYLNIFPHASGRMRPCGPETDPHSKLGFTKWLIEEIKMPAIR